MEFTYSQITLKPHFQFDKYFYACTKSLEVKKKEYAPKKEDVPIMKQMAVFMKLSGNISDEETDAINSVQQKIYADNALLVSADEAEKANSVRMIYKYIETIISAAAFN